MYRCTLPLLLALLFVTACSAESLTLRSSVACPTSAGETIETWCDDVGNCEIRTASTSTPCSARDASCAQRLQEVVTSCGAASSTTDGAALSSCLTNTPCTADSQCTAIAGTSCNTRVHRCQRVLCSPIGGECSHNAHCQGDMECSTRFGCYLSAGCDHLSNRGCASGTQCTAGSCIAAGQLQIGEACTLRPEQPTCASGTLCDLRHCSPKCTSDSQCPSGQGCILITTGAGVCRALPSCGEDCRTCGDFWANRRLCRHEDASWRQPNCRFEDRDVYDVAAESQLRSCISQVQCDVNNDAACYEQIALQNGWAADLYRNAELSNAPAVVENCAAHYQARGCHMRGDVVARQAAATCELQEHLLPVIQAELEPCLASASAGCEGLVECSDYTWPDDLTL